MAGALYEALGAESGNFTMFDKEGVLHRGGGVG